VILPFGTLSERRQSADHEVWISRPALGIPNAKGGSRFEPESPVVAGVAEQENKRNASEIATPNDLLHQGTAYASPLIGGTDGEWSDSNHGLSRQNPPGAQYVADDLSVADGNEVEPVDLGIAGPDRLNYVDLILLVMTSAGEGGTKNP
jgi:hypothetical protein